MNKGKKVLFIGLILAISNAESANIEVADINNPTRIDQLRAFGVILRESKVFGEINPDAGKYVFTPAAEIGDFLFNIDILEPELTKAVESLKSFKLLAKSFPKCSRLKESTLEQFKKPDNQLSGNVLLAKKECAQVACAGSKTDCLIQALKDLEKVIGIFKKVLFGYYKVKIGTDEFGQDTFEKKAYLACPEGKACEKVRGIADLTLSIAQQEKIYTDVLKPKVERPLDKVLTIMQQLEKILQAVKIVYKPSTSPTSGTKVSSPTSTTPAVPVTPVKPAAPAITETTIPEAPSMESNIPEAPALEPANNVPEAPELGEISGLKPTQLNIPTKKPAQESISPQKSGGLVKPSAEDLQAGKTRLKPSQPAPKPKSDLEQQIEQRRKAIEEPWSTE